MVVVFRAHDHDRHGGHGAVAARQHREQHLFFFLHVAFQFLLHGAQVIGQARRAVRAVGVDLFHLQGQADEFGQLLTVDLVVTRQDVIDQLGRRSQPPVRFLRGVLRQGDQARLDLRGIQRTLGCRLGQALLAATAEVQFEFVKHLRGAGNAAGQLAQGLLNHAHRVSP